MKKYLILFGVLFAGNLYAQDTLKVNSVIPLEPIIKMDTVIMRSGDILVVNIVQSTPEYIMFCYPDEDMNNAEYKNAIQRIIYKSGRIEECASKFNLATITSKDDWEKVIITFLESDVRGLTKIGEINATSGWGGALATGKGSADAQNKLKKKAAEMGASIVLIVDKPNAATTALGAGVKLTGIAYK